MKSNISNIEEIVATKVTQAIADKEKQLKTMQHENEVNKEKLAMMDSQVRTLNQDKSRLQDTVQSLNTDLAQFMRSGDSKDFLLRLEAVRKEKDVSEKKQTELLHEINRLSN